MNINIDLTDEQLWMLLDTIAPKKPLVLQNPTTRKKYYVIHEIDMAYLVAMIAKGEERQ